jgi:hypothetical protein
MARPGLEIHRKDVSVPTSLPRRGVFLSLLLAVVFGGFAKAEDYSARRVVCDLEGIRVYAQEITAESPVPNRVDLTFDNHNNYPVQVVWSCTVNGDNNGQALDSGSTFVGGHAVTGHSMITFNDSNRAANVSVTVTLIPIKGR